MKIQNAAMLMAMYAATLSKEDVYSRKFLNSDGDFAGALRQHKKNIAKQGKHKKRKK